MFRGFNRQAETPVETPKTPENAGVEETPELPDLVGPVAVVYSLAWRANDDRHEEAWWLPVVVHIDQVSDLIHDHLRYFNKKEMILVRASTEKAAHAAVEREVTKAKQSLNGALNIVQGNPHVFMLGGK